MLGKGSPVWYPHEREGFRAGSVEAIDGDAVQVCDPELNAIVKVNRVQKRCSKRTLEMSFDDMSNMPELSDSSILHNLRLRYASDAIYTNIGATLVALNPYRQVNSGLDEGSPGIRQTVRHIYDQMMQTRENYSCVVTGESGAGKTESVRTFINHLAQISIDPAGEQALSEEARAHQHLLKERIVQVSPILESFGNAKTIRNDNSSRFGKWIEIEIDFSTGQPLSANIRNYMLEKSRIVSQAPNERNYHAFYQLLADEERCAQLQLDTSPQAYRILRQPSLSDMGIDDRAGLECLKRAMHTIGMDADEMAFVFRTLGALLLLGNVQFALNDDATTEGTAVATLTTGFAEQSTVCLQSRDGFARASGLLSIDSEALAQGLTCRSIRSGKSECVLAPLSTQDAEARLDALIKAVYHALFSWVTERINVALDGIADEIEAEAEELNGGQYGRHIESGTIGILDAFGFEIFETNSFEQLCINYCNEKMQLHFNQLVFEQEIEEYEEEGILTQKESEGFTFGGPSDGMRACLQLLETNGIFSLIDDELKLPKGNDQSLLRKIVARHEDHPNFSVPPRKVSKGAGLFTISHYAGRVTYDIEGFLLKNFDPLPLELQLLCARSGDALLSESFPTEEEIMENTKGRKANRSLGTQFKAQLSFLSAMIFEESTPHFIRCIKPNDKAKSKCWEGARVLQQIRYAGLLEASSVRARGFPARHKFKDFVRKCAVIQDPSVHSFINTYPWVHDQKPKREGKEEETKQEEEEEEEEPTIPREHFIQGLCTRLEEIGVLQEGQDRVGHTKIFFRGPQANHVAETLLQEQDTSVVPIIQRLARGYLTRHRVWTLKSAIERLQTSLFSSDDAAVIRADLQQLQKAPRTGCSAALNALAARITVAANDRLDYLENGLKAENDIKAAVASGEFAAFAAALDRCELLRQAGPVIEHARSLRDCQHRAFVVLTEIDSLNNSHLARRPAAETVGERQVARAMLNHVRGLLAEVGALKLSDEEREFLFSNFPGGKLADWKRTLTSAHNGSVAVERFLSAVIIQQFFTRMQRKAGFRLRIRVASDAAQQLRSALREKNQGGIECALREMAQVGLQPAHLVEQARAALVDIEYSRLAATNQLERLTKRLARRIKQREREVAQYKASAVDEPNMALAKNDGQAKKPKRFRWPNKKAKSKTAGAATSSSQGPPTTTTSTTTTSSTASKPSRFSMLRSTFSLANLKSKNKVRKSELELLQHAIDNAYKNNVSEDHESMKCALDLVQRLESLRQCRPGTVERMFSSSSLISATSTVASSSTRQKAAANHHSQGGTEEYDEEEKHNIGSGNSQREAFRGLDLNDFNSKRFSRGSHESDLGCDVTLVEEDEGDLLEKNEQQGPQKGRLARKLSVKKMLGREKSFLADQQGEEQAKKQPTASFKRRLFKKQRTTVASNPNLNKSSKDKKRRFSKRRKSTGTTTTTTKKDKKEDVLGQMAKSYRALREIYGRPPPPAPEPGTDNLDDAFAAQVQDTLDDWLASHELVSSQQRVIFERITREQEMRKVVEDRYCKERRGIAGPLAKGAIAQYKRDKDYSFSSMYSQKNISFESAGAWNDARLKRMSTGDRRSSLSSFASQSSQTTIPNPEGKRYSWDHSLRRKFPEIMFETFSSAGHQSMTTHSTHAYKEHWEAVSFVSRNVVSTKQF